MTDLEKIYETFTSMKNEYNKQNNYNINDNNINDIHMNIDNIFNDEKIACDLFTKISSHKKMIRDILTFDMLNYTPVNKLSDIEQIIILCKEILKKYQYKVGGFNIEDDEWILCKESNHRMKLKKNQSILYNSIEKKNCNEETIWFLESIMNYMNRSINNQLKKIKYSIVEDEKNCICWIIFCFTDNLNYDTIKK